MIVYYLAPLKGRTLQHDLRLLPDRFADPDSFGTASLTGLLLTQTLSPDVFVNANLFGLAAVDFVSSLRVTQMLGEVAYHPQPNLRTTQVRGEAAYKQAPLLRTTQVFAEVAYKP